jgi:hypothetical protein
MKKCFCTAAVLIIALISFSICTAEEGLVIECLNNHSVMSIGGFKTNTIEYITANKTRSESVSEPYGLMKFDPDSEEENTVEIKDYSTGTGWEIDVLTETYRITDISPPPDVEKETMDSGLVSFDLPQQTISGEYTWVTTLDSADVKEVVNGYLCKKVTIHSVCNATETDSLLMVSDIWVCDSFPGMDIYRNYQTNQRLNYGFEEGIDLQEMESFNEILKLHMKEIFRRSLLFNNMVIKSSMDLLILKEDYNNPDDLQDTFNDQLMSQAIGMFQTLFDSSTDETLIRFMSMSYEVVSIVKKDMSDSLFVLPEGYTKKE